MSKEWGKGRGYWSALRLSEGADILDEYRVVGDDASENEGSTWRSESLPESNMSPTGKAILFMLLGLSGFVLLIA